MVRHLTASEVTFALDCLPEDIPIHGNASAFDDETDARIEGDIRSELARGNDFAWCCIRVRATWKEYTGDDFLGACTYASEDEFCRPGGYFDDMKLAALDALNATIAIHEQAIEPLRV